MILTNLAALNESIKADHGFHIESRAIKDLLELMISFDTAKRRQFLQFITGSPRLPVGGWCRAYSFDGRHCLT